MVILLSEMGSLVLAQPMLEELKRRYPGATLQALVFARNREALDLLGLIAPAEVLTLDDRSFWQFAMDSLRVLRTARALQFDVVDAGRLYDRQFQNGVRGQTRGKPPRRDGLARLADLLFLVDINQIDGELHEEGMDRFARLDPQPFPGRKTGMLEQAGTPFLTRVRNIHSLAENGIAGQVAHGYFQFRKTITRRGTGRLRRAGNFSGARGFRID